MPEASRVGGFNPASLGLAAWYDFPDIAALFQNTSRTTPVTVATDPVGGVTDKSGSGNHATQSVDASRPTYATGVQNGKSGLLFNGKSLVAPSLYDSTWNKAWSIFVVGKTNTVLQISTGISGNHYTVHDTYLSGINFVAASKTLTRWNQSAVGSVDSLIATYDGTRIRVRVHGYESIVPFTANNLLSGAPGIGIYGASFPWIQHLFEIGIRKAVFTEAEQKNLDAYVSAKYGLSAYYPASPLSFTAPQFVAEGDSLTFGYNAQSDYPSQLAHLLPGYNYDNVSVTGSTIAILTSRAATTDTLKNTARTKNILVVWIGTNDIGGGRTDVQVEGDLQTYCQARQAAGWTVVVCTIIARGDAPWTGGMETFRLNVNTWIRANYTGFASGLIDLANDSRLQTPTNTTYFNADKLHLVTAGYAVPAALAQPVVAAQ